MRLELGEAVQLRRPAEHLGVEGQRLAPRCRGKWMYGVSGVNGLVVEVARVRLHLSL